MLEAEQERTSNMQIKRQIHARLVSETIFLLLSTSFCGIRAENAQLPINPIHLQNYENEKLLCGSCYWLVI
jgi:hypothetical protein